MRQKLDSLTYNLWATRGKRARLDNLPEIACPEPIQSKRAQAWIAGWRDQHQHLTGRLTKQIKSATRFNIARHGYAAAINEEPPTANPYRRGSMKWEIWDNAWIEGYQKR